MFSLLRKGSLLRSLQVLGFKSHGEFFKKLLDRRFYSSCIVAVIREKVETDSAVGRLLSSGAYVL